ncbi:hypothetical protein [uncultured Roseobacter sp.]|uniref:hypothetical protein n=1 Tax=uncultured Roseobacter sp. TaxID=114847 RepID=UPI002631B22A|nr:hypothetical protein [uncultured Roseobacter sp.]
MNQTLKLPAALLAVASLSACMTGTVPVSQAQPSLLQQDDLSLSCGELSARNGRIVARAREIEAESRTRARQDAIANTAVNLGLGVLMGGAARGGLTGVQAAGAVSQATTRIRNAEGSQERLQEVTDAMALARRSAELQRAMVEKGCSGSA